MSRGRARALFAAGDDAESLPGLVAGVAIAASLIVSGNDLLRGVNAGFVAVVANLGMTAAVSLLRKAEAADPSGLLPQVLPESVDS